MAKKARTRAREDDKPTRPAGNKPVKVVTFDTPKSEYPERPQFSKTHDVSDYEPTASSPAPWGQSASDGWNNSSSYLAQPTSPVSHPAPPPAPQIAWAPPTSPLPRASSTAPAGENFIQRSHKLMIEEPLSEHQNRNAKHHHADANQSQWGTPASNGGEPLPVPPTPQLYSPIGTTQSFGAMGATTKNPTQWTTASEQARQFARPPATSQPPLQQAPKPSAPIPPHVKVQSQPQMSVHQWAARSKAAPASAPAIERFGNRDDYAVVAAALNGEIKRAHYSRKQDYSGHGGSETASAIGGAGWRNNDWNQQGQQNDTGWGAHSKGHDAGRDTRLKGRNDGAGWANASDAGWSHSGRSGHHDPQKDQSHSSSAKHHAKSWQAWGKQGRVESEPDSESEEEEDDEGWYAEQPSNAAEGWGGQGDSGWGNQSGSGWGEQGGSGWDQGNSGWGSRGGGKKENGGLNTSGGDGWTMNSRGDDLGDQRGETSSRKENNGWDTSGGGGWTTNSGGWDNNQGRGTNQSSWGQSKVITDPPGNAGARNSLSPEQRSQILNNLLDDPHERKSHNQPLYSHGVSLTDNPVPHKGHNQWQSWGQQDGWDPIQEEDEEDSEIGDVHPPTVAQSKAGDPWNNMLDNTSYSMPSKTLTYAYQDVNTSLDPSKPRNSVSDHTAVQFVESHGTALKPVEQALFGRARWAQDRIHWMFSPYKDERVSTLLTWIESMAYHLGSFGLHKFLQSRERGAIITNAAFRLPEFPGQPVFDWLTYDQLQDTMDKTLQESVVFYDPGVQVIVFVLLPSPSGRSVAMWRRKVKVPNNARVTYQAPITQALAGLKKKEDYVVYVDRIPLKPEDPDKSKAPDVQKAATEVLPKPPTKKLVKNSSAPAKKKKRKWWQIFK